MPQFERHGISIYYEVRGEGFPLLLFAPGGMRSTASFWARMPFNPIDEFAGDFQVIAMDQRNAGHSKAPVSASDGWQTYAEDQAGLLDHLGIERACLMGGCIGSSYVLEVIERIGAARVPAAVLQNPIGLSDSNRGVFRNMFKEWADELKAARPDVDQAALDSFGGNMFDADFVFSVSRDFVRSCPVPFLVLPGNDDFHPTATAREIADLAPHAEYVGDWREPENVRNTVERIRTFLKANTPGAGQ